MKKQDMNEKIKNLIKNALQVPDGFVVEYPAQFSHGDYSTNVALVEAKKNGKNPKELAEEFVKILNDKKIDGVEKIETAGPGFINFFLKPEVFSDVVSKAVDERPFFGRNEKLKGQKTIIEYTDPNPFKEFHIGHLMSNTIGESISRIVEGEGAEVKRLSYGGDVGLHVAKSIFAVLSQKEKIAEIMEKSKREQLTFWANSYVLGSSKYEEDENAKKGIDDLNKIIFDKSDAEINKLYEWGRAVSIEHFQEMFKRLGTDFYRNFWESEVVDGAMKAVKIGLEKNILEKSEGAVIFRGENYGLHTRVFVNSKSVPTYEAKELGLSLIKYKEFSFDKSIVITGNEQNDYFKVLLKVMDLLIPESANKTVHIGHGMLRFAEGKMSSRKGNVITAENLMSDIKAKILEKMKDRDMNDEKKMEIAEIVSIGALKYSILKQTIGKDIIFDMEKSVSFEGDSGPYLQYATVRANSILEKAGISGGEAFGTPKTFPREILPKNWQTTNLERMIERFGGVVEKAGNEYAPSGIVTYLMELAGEFNSFYAKNKIIDDTDSSPYKLLLTRGFANVMTAGLHLLGIKVPEEM